MTNVLTQPNNEETISTADLPDVDLYYRDLGPNTRLEFQIYHRGPIFGKRPAGEVRVDVYLAKRRHFQPWQKVDGVRRTVHYPPRTFNFATLMRLVNQVEQDLFSPSQNAADTEA